MNRLAGSFAAGALGLVVASSAFAAAPTRLERWTPFRAGKVAPGFHVVQRGSGTCLGGSPADARSDAWRCLSGNGLQDPCFSDGPSLTSVICPDGTPDSRDALQLQLTKPLPQNRANPSSNTAQTAPWAIDTVTGLYCYRATGTSPILAGRHLTYTCAGAASLAGNPDRARSEWTISLLPTATSKSYLTVAIRSVWW